MELYKRRRSAAGRLPPILVQMPIFIALYWALMEFCRAAPRAVRPVDHRPVGEGPSCCQSSWVPPMWYLQNEPDHHHGPDAAEGDAVHAADHLHLHVPLVPGRSDSVLAGEQRHLIIQQTIIYRQLEKKGLHSRN